MDSPVTSQRLKKELGLFDVFAVSTGAMFSSGFFLLPGLAAAKAGPSVVLAYLLAGVLILPAMFSKAELSTALPRAGGTYYFLDRALGPVFGTIGGLGTYLALSLKTAFALVGIGAYAAFYVDLPIKTVAIALTAVFMLFNLIGAKETTALQRWLVITLLAVLAFFTVQGFVHVFTEADATVTRERFSPFFEFGVTGMLSTIGFVFVSYAGLTKVASVAEEVKNPERNIPLGMMLSLGVTSFIYVAGVFIIVAVLPPGDLHRDLTPVATASKAFFDWLPGEIGLLLIVIAALAAFASTGNAGLMSASRYPLAMARDRLLPAVFTRLGRFNTPAPAILATGGLMMFFIVVLQAEGIAKLASAFQLFIFMLVNFAVIVMRQSGIPSYDPGYRSPLYPWMQIFGIVVCFVLIVYMGWLAILFTLGIVLFCLLWYAKYVRDKVERDGAIYHWFHNLGRRQYDGLDREFRTILKEKGLREDDPFEEIVARSFVIDLVEETTFEDVIDRASQALSRRLPRTAEQIRDRFMQGTLMGETPVTGGVALPHFRVEPLDQAEMVLVRARHPVLIPGEDPTRPGKEVRVGALFFLVSPERDPAQHLRILAQIAGRVDEDTFTDDWRTARGAQGLREVLLRDERFMHLVLHDDTPAMALTGKPLRDLSLPEGVLLALVRRGHHVIIPQGSTVLRAKDRLTLIGEPDGLQELRRRYLGDASAEATTSAVDRS